MKNAKNDIKPDNWQEVVQLTFEGCKNILYCKKIIDKNENMIFRESLFMNLIVRLNLLRYYLVNNNIEINDSKIETIGATKCKDFKYSIYNLLTDVRNAACHIESKKNELNGRYYRFNILLGKEVKNKYSQYDFESDAVIEFGDIHILYWRHIIFFMCEISRVLKFEFDAKETLIK